MPEAGAPDPARDRGKTVHGEAANAGHRVLAPDDAEVEAYLEVALDAPRPTAPPRIRRSPRSSPSRASSPSWTSAPSSRS